MSSDGETQIIREVSRGETPTSTLERKDSGKVRVRSESKI